MLLGGAPFKQSNGHVGRVATEVVDGQQRSADDSRAQVHAVRRKQRCIGRGVKLGEHSLVRKRRPRRVRAEQ